MQDGKTWQDFLDQAAMLIEKNMVDTDDEVALAKKLFIINKNREEEAATSSPPKQDN